MKKKGKGGREDKDNRELDKRNRRESLEERPK